MDRISKLKEYLETSSDDSFLQHALALEFTKTGNDAEAKILFEEILEREPSYLGSYYHLGKLLERNGDIQTAMKVYERGMQESRALDDSHAYNELKNAYQNLF